jgi:exopolysaccharide biosynthesis polyprenyl glycosylphosphotransferase
VIKSVLIDFVLLAACTAAFYQLYFARELIPYFAGYSLLFVFGQRVVSQLLIGSMYRQGFNLRKVLVVGDGTRGTQVTELMTRQLSWGHKVIGTLETGPGETGGTEDRLSIDQFLKMIKDNEVDEVIFAVGADRSINLSEYLEVCRKVGVPARILPAMWRPGGKDISVELCQGIPFLTFQVDKLDASGLLYKRILDLTGGLIGTLFFLIIYPVVAVAIKLDSPGPVLFKQKRVSRHGRTFDIYKFRSMYQDAEEKKIELMSRNEMDGAMFKINDDPRITRVGKWLRKMSLDEFPQFLNVVKGEMSLVGTRPPTPEEVDKYKLWHLKRISAKPGLTGLWQVSGRNKITDFDKVVELDCQYLDNWRLRDDFKIIIKTILVVLQRKGAV